jgi:hypothetical protein
LHNDTLPVPNHSTGSHIRLWKSFCKFMVSVGYTDSVESVEKELRQGPTVPANYPTRVAAWIMSKLAFVI